MWQFKPWYLPSRVVHCGTFDGFAIVFVVTSFIVTVKAFAASLVSVSESRLETIVAVSILDAHTDTFDALAFVFVVIACGWLLV